MEPTLFHRITDAPRGTGPTLSRMPKIFGRPARKALILSGIAISLLLSACNAPLSTPPTPTPTPTPTATPTIAPTDTPEETDTPTATPAQTGTPANATPMPGGTPTPTALDPCQLITAEEASALSGATYKAGVEGTLPGGARTCTYGGNTANVFYIEVGQAKDEAGAKAYQAEFLAIINSHLAEAAAGGLTITQLPSYADGAVFGSLNASAINVTASVFGFRKGTVFFGFNDSILGGQAPSQDKMTAQADTVLGRLP